LRCLVLDRACLPHLRSQHQVNGQQAEEPLGIFILAFVRETDAPLRVLLEKV
jgi:hypothetical protein